MVLGVTVACPEEHGMRLERAEAALGGELVKKKREIRDFSKLG